MKTNKEKVVDEIIGILNKYQTTDPPEFTDKFVDPFSFHKIAEEIYQLYSAGEEVYVETKESTSIVAVKMIRGDGHFNLVPVRLKKLTRPTVSEEEVKSILKDAFNSGKNLNVTFREYWDMAKNRAAIKELNR